MGTTVEKLAYLKETKSQIKQALETPYNVMRDYPALIKKYIDNQPTSIVSDGNCTNALDVPLVSLGVDGNSYQGENPSPENPQDIEVIKGFEEGNQFGLPYGHIGLRHSNEDGSKSEVIPINLNGNSIAKVGDVKDLLKVYRNGDVEIEKKSGKVVLDGSENGWSIKQDGTKARRFDNKTFNLNLNNVDDMSSKTSTHFLYRRLNNNNWGKFYLSKDWLVLNDNDNIIQSLDDFKTWLSQNLPEIYYQLAEPQTIKLPSMKPIELWEGTNKFELITNLDTTFEMEYVVDKDYLEKQNLLNIVEGENL